MIVIQIIKCWSRGTAAPHGSSLVDFLKALELEEWGHARGEERRE